MEARLDFIPDYCPHCGNSLRDSNQETVYDGSKYHEGDKEKTIKIKCKNCDDMVVIYVELNNPFFNM